MSRSRTSCSIHSRSRLSTDTRSRLSTEAVHDGSTQCVYSCNTGSLETEGSRRLEALDQGLGDHRASTGAGNRKCGQPRESACLFGSKTL